jgi:hypothetical protein
MKVEEAISVLTQLSEEDLSAWIKIDTPEIRQIFKEHSIDYKLICKFADEI